ncbi:MAG: tRNA uridine-5-carboxymethylaminomethyl(34) synthesis GTPase MnmE [Pararhodobacter sp.]
MDTIVAVATPPGRGGVAVLRVSGDRAWSVCEAIAGSVPLPRVATLRTLRDLDGEIIDRGLVLLFEEGQSFTGEAVCEFQVHGSVAVVGALLRACLKIEGVRAAEAGEFTKRAFVNGKMDLVEVEALADLIEAETDSQRRKAMRVLDGTASKIIADWREDLLSSLAMLEAALDFADEELPDDLTDLVEAPLIRVRNSLAEQVSGRAASESVREGFEVAIVGPVNAGKSTLLNALAGREAAITSEREGTTRDVIEVRMEIGGLSVTLIDTAGLRETGDEIEQIGIRRGIERARAADLRIYLTTNPKETVRVQEADDIVLLSKSDVHGMGGISAKTGEGLGELIDRIEALLKKRIAGQSIFSRERHFDKLTRAEKFLASALSALKERSVGWEIVSEDIRAAIRCLDGVVGRVDVEDVLGRIFSSFCIGK